MTLDDPTQCCMIRSKKSFESPIFIFEVLDDLVPTRPQDPYDLIDSRYTLHLSSTSADMPLQMPSSPFPGTSRRRSRFSLFLLPEPAPEVRASDILPCLQQNSKGGVPSGSESTRLDRSIECGSIA